MKKLLYIFIGIAIALGAVVLYSFKAKENAEVSYATICGIDNLKYITIFYDDGHEEDLVALLDLKVGDNRDKGQLPFQNSINKSLKHISHKGYKVIGINVLNSSIGMKYHYYTLIKEN